MTDNDPTGSFAVHRRRESRREDGSSRRSSPSYERTARRFRAGTSVASIRAVELRLHSDHHQHPAQHEGGVRIVKNMIALVEGQQVEFVAALFRSIWGAEPGRLPYLYRPSFYGEILCCWRPRWIVESEGSPMHAYAWYVWRKEPRSGPSLKVRVGMSETITALSAVNLPMRD